MELNKTKRSFYLLISFSVAMLLLLGSWWLYLVFKLAYKLEEIQVPLLQGNLINMVKWEGLSFFLLLLFLSLTLLYIYIQDHKKTVSLQAFFASLTHELKTPLASMKLQGEVLHDLISQTKLEEGEKDKLNKYTQRLISDALRLEDQLDNHLQLSRAERKAPLNLVSVNLCQAIEKEAKRYDGLFHLNIENIPSQLHIKADEFALEMIFRNLFENSLKHQKAKLPNINISFDPQENKVIYNDHGEPFKGDKKKLGKLFYKFNSPQGSGIGLYLIRTLMKQMGGAIEFDSSSNLIFHLSFPLAQEAINV